MDFDTFELSVWVGILLVIALLVGAVGRSMHVNERCKTAGYREGQVVWNFSGFCIKRVDQTDIVVPLERVKETHFADKSDKKG